jgi:integrase
MNMLSQIIRRRAKKEPPVEVVCKTCGKGFLAFVSNIKHGGGIYCSRECGFKNVRMTFHDTRRTFASLHATAGTSIYKISKWLGDDVDVVQRHYGHLSPADPEINRAFSAIHRGTQGSRF